MTPMGLPDKRLVAMGLSILASDVSAPFPVMLPDPFI